MDSGKIRRDFLKLVGNLNPSIADLQRLEAIPESQLLKTIVIDCRGKGLSLKMISLRYGVELHTIKAISRTTCKVD